MSTTGPETPQLIGPPDFELWSGRLWLDHTAWSPKTVQITLGDYANETGKNAIGYYAQAYGALTLLRWPDNRPGYHVNSVEECHQSLGALATMFSAFKLEAAVMPQDRLHCLLGLRIGGYESELFADSDTVRERLPEAIVEDVHMVSARSYYGIPESYGEPAAAIIAAPDSLDAIKALAVELQQHHFAVEDGFRSVTHFYETHWANPRQ